MCIQTACLVRRLRIRILLLVIVVPVIDDVIMYSIFVFFVVIELDGMQKYPPYRNFFARILKTVLAQVSRVATESPSAP